MNRPLFFMLFLALPAWAAPTNDLPRRLVLGLDGVAYRDLKALQAGVVTTNFWGRTVRRQAFTAEEGYFPVSRMVSTFPSTSDVAWTEIYGDRPLPGYQRTYYSEAANRQIALNGVATTMEHERQMDWQVQDGFLRSMGYLMPVRIFDYEAREMIRHFLAAHGNEEEFYAYIRASDDAQHMDRNIQILLCRFDQQLQQLRAEYKKRMGRDLEIVIISDHGNNHAGRGRRVKIVTFLEQAGYRISKSIEQPKDVVLPTAGIESWVEVHNAPEETESLARLLTGLKGVDLVTARLAGQTNRFLVLDSKGGRAIIERNADAGKYRYRAEAGDPLDFLPVVELLAQKGSLDPDGFASAGDWSAETMTRHYPLALERIVHGLTRGALNPATILISLKDGYAHVGWAVNAASHLVAIGGTHGGLDDLTSDGILLSNFTPTQDTPADRAADQFDGFPNLNDYRAEENGAELVSRGELTLARIQRTPLDRDAKTLPGDEVFLRVWMPQFAQSANDSSLEVVIDESRRFTTTRSRRPDLDPPDPRAPHFELAPSGAFEAGNFDRIYSLPSGLTLRPQTAYEMTGWGHESGEKRKLFQFTFWTDSQGRPTAY
jgi:Type I phosphodiesterase / nucleotide pyrophosphatase